MPAPISPIELPVVSPHTVHTKLNFFKKTTDGKKAFYTRQPVEGAPSENIVRASADVDIRDLRGIEQELSLDRNGFEFHKFQTSLSYDDFEDDSKVLAFRQAILPDVPC
jgi:hypothetical protein